MPAALRGRVHQAFAQALSATGELQRAAHAIARAGAVVVLTLHRIVPDRELDACRSPRGMVLRESLFRNLLAYLTHATDVIRPQDLRAHPMSASSSGARRPRVLLTFDDGWADNAEIALPHLAEAGVTAQFFIATGLIGRSNPFWPERVQSLLESTRDPAGALRRRRLLLQLETPATGQAPQATSPATDEEVLTWLKQFSPPEILQWLDTAEGSPSIPHPSRMQPAVQDMRERMMSEQQLRALLAAGHDLGSHTCTHALLPSLGAESMRRELVASKATLEQLTPEQRAVLAVSYPNGAASEKEALAASQAGYHLGFTTAVGVWRATSPQLLIPRINVWDGTITRHDGTFCDQQLGYALFWRPLHAREPTIRG